MKKRIASVLLAGVLTVGALTGCGATQESGANTAEAADGATTVKIGVVGSVYDELWAPAKEALAADGINLEIVQFSDYNTPNNALNSGEIDLNAFQHQIFLQSDVEANGYDVETIGYTFIIPLNVYSNKVTSIEEIGDGDTIAIPNDVTNGGRAIKVLEAAGLITLKEDAQFSPTLDDIETYNVDITIQELQANTIPSVLDDVTAAVVNGNYALDFGLKTEEAIFQDTSVNEQEYWNIIVARSADLEDAAKVETYQKVIDAFQSEATQQVFDDSFGGYFISVGWDEELLK